MHGNGGEIAGTSHTEEGASRRGTPSPPQAQVERGPARREELSRRRASSGCRSGAEPCPRRTAPRRSSPADLQGGLLLAPSVRLGFFHQPSPLTSHPDGRAAVDCRLSLLIGLNYRRLPILLHDLIVRGVDSHHQFASPGRYARAFSGPIPPFTSGG
jgi:hypothetical protein